MSRLSTGAARIAAELGTAILAGVPAEGEIIQGELALAQRFGASRTVVREALTLLAAKGLVEPRKRAGTSVRPRAAWRMLDPDILAWRLGAREGEAKLAADLMQVRSIIEPEAAALAAARAATAEGRAAIAVIDAAFADMQRTAHDRALFIEPDRRFHAAILAATVNEFMVAFGSLIEAALDLLLRIATRHAGAPGPSVPMHGKVLAAIRRGDAAGARRAMASLLATSSQNVARNVTRTGPSRGPR